MSARRETFKGYGNAAASLRSMADAEGRTELMRAEVLQYSGISGSRFNWLVDSALFSAMCSEPVGRTSPAGRGSALYFNVDELVRFLLALRDPKAQAILLADCWALDGESFSRKYMGKTKEEIFDGRHAIIETDNDCFVYEAEN